MKAGMETGPIEDLIGHPTSIEAQVSVPTFVPPPGGGGIDEKLYRPIVSNIKDSPGPFFRLLSLNINGFNSHALGQDVTNLMRTARLANAHLISFSEPNVDFTTPKAKYTITSAAKNSESAMRVQLTSSRIRTNTYYKPGGIATFARDKGYHRCTEILEDPTGLGQYTVSLLSGNSCQSLAVFSIYQCCKGSEGPKSIFGQQMQVMRENNMEMINPREQLWSDLGQAILAQRSKGRKIIVMGDFNHSLYNDSNRLRDFCRENDLLDPLATLLPEEKNTATHIMGSSRIDYALVEPSILPHIRAFGLTGIGDPFISDHRATFLDIDFRSMFGEKLAPIVKGGKRMVTTKIDKRTPIFLRFVGEASKNQRIRERCQEILQLAASIGPTESVGKKFALLDRDFRNILLKSEEKAGRNPNGRDWSSKLHLALLEYRFWGKYLQTSRKRSRTLHALAQNLGWPDGFPRACWWGRE